MSDQNVYDNIARVLKEKEQEIDKLKAENEKLRELVKECEIKGWIEKAKKYIP